MAFLDERLEDEISSQAITSIEDPIIVSTTRSGAEQIIGHWDSPRRTLSFDFTAAGADFIDPIRAFLIRVGRSNTFRARDWDDFEVNAENLEPVASTIDGNRRTDTWRIVKRYGDRVRRITKPEDGTFEFDPSSPYRRVSNVDYSTGIVTLVGPRPITEELPVHCRFDLHARVDNSTIDITLSNIDVKEITSLRLIEVLEEDR